MSFCVMSPLLANLKTLAMGEWFFCYTESTHSHVWAGVKLGEIVCLCKRTKKRLHDINTKNHQIGCKLKIILFFSDGT